MSSNGLKGQLKQFVKNFLLSHGFDIIYSVNNPRFRLIQSHKINLLLDIGANIGLYAETIRRYGYRGRIVSFEPMSKEYSTIAKKVANDPLWEAYHCALGSSNEESEINVAGNSFSSSLLPMNERHAQSAPDSIYTKKEHIKVATLDSLADEILGVNDSIYLKADVQGFEKEVLKGAQASLKNVKLIELELSLATLYDNQPLYREMIDFLDHLGYDLVFVDPGFTDVVSGEMLQMDGIFRRRSEA